MPRRQTQPLPVAPPPRDLPLLAFTPEETADILTVGRTSVYGLMKDGRLHPVKIGTKSVISRFEIERFLREEAR